MTQNNNSNSNSNSNSNPSSNSNSNPIILTDDQELIYEQMINFVKSDGGSRELILIGYAGTGKTTMVAKFINDLIKTKLCKKIVMVAPTHKAVNIAKSKLFDNVEEPDELAKIINIMTIHRLLNYQSYIGQEGEKFFAKGKLEPNWSIYDLVVVDECSMLTNQIIADIKIQLTKDSNPNVKIIYVGDPAQLPPVNQGDSKIFNSNIQTLKLDKIIRTSNQQIMDLSNAHREWIFSKNNSDIPRVGEYESESIQLYSCEQKETKKWLDDFIQLLKSNGKKIVSDLDFALEPELESNLIKTKSNTDFGNIILDHKIMIDNHNNNIILTWTNKKANLYNQYVREKIFNKKKLAHYEIGEILIFNDFHKINQVNPNPNPHPNQFDIDIDIDIDINMDINMNANMDNNKLNKIDQVSFYTSEQVKLHDIQQIKYNFISLKFKINNNLTPELNNKFKKHYKKINLLIGNIELDVYEMKIQKITDLVENEQDNQNILTYTILSLHPDSEKKYSILNDEIEKIIANLKTVCYDEINTLPQDNMGKCNLQSEVEKKINKLYKEYQTNIIDCFAQLNYGYCMTAHKSQGSTFKNVFVDINDILNNNNSSETSKCIYTTITRSSKTLKLLI